MVVAVNDVLDQIAAALHRQDRTSLQPFWTVIATQALPQGLNDVQEIFIQRGFTAAQLASWPDYDPAVKYQALYWSLQQAAPLNDQPMNVQAVKGLDQRLKLWNMVIADAMGNPIIPTPV
jgi:hypothetical protein